MVLPHEQLAGPRRRTPVHVPQVVAGHVLAQRVEGEVAHRQLVAGDPLEVAQLADGQPGEVDGRGAHQELDRLGPADASREQPDRVGAPVEHRTDRDHPAPRGRDHERLLVGTSRPQRRQLHPAGRQAARHLDHRPADRDGPPVLQAQASLDVHSGTGPVRPQRQRGADVGGQQHDHEADHDQQQAQRRHHGELHEAGHPREGQRQQAQGDDAAPERGDPAPEPPPAAAAQPGQSPVRSTGGATCSSSPATTSATRIPLNWACASSSSR